MLASYVVALCQCCVMFCHVMLCYVTLDCVTLRDLALRYLTFRYVMFYNDFGTKLKKIPLNFVAGPQDRP